MGQHTEHASAADAAPAVPVAVLAPAAGPRPGPSHSSLVRAAAPSPAPAPSAAPAPGPGPAADDLSAWSSGPVFGGPAPRLVGGMPPAGTTVRTAPRPAAPVPVAAPSVAPVAAPSVAPVPAAARPGPRPARAFADAGAVAEAARSAAWFAEVPDVATGAARVRATVGRTTGLADIATEPRTVDTVALRHGVVGASMAELYAARRPAERPAGDGAAVRNAWRDPDDGAGDMFWLVSATTFSLSALLALASVGEGPLSALWRGLLG